MVIKRVILMGKLGFVEFEIESLGMLKTSVLYASVYSFLL